MKNKVIKASAGTGKTYTLSIEYLNLLINGADAENIFVITFTRKATAEIRAKIFENIRKILTGSEKESSMVIESLIKIDEQNKKYEKTEIIKKIEVIYKEISLRKDKIKITTIDSFINTLFSKYTAPEMNIYSYEITDEFTNREYLMKSFEKIIENRESFEKITMFLKKYAERDVEKYIDWIKFILDNRWIFAMYEEDLVEDRASFERCKLSYKKLTDVFYGIPGLFELRQERGNSAVFLKDFAEIFKNEFEEIDRRDYKTFINAKSFWKKAAVKKDDNGEYMLSGFFEKFKKELASYIYSSEIVPLFYDLKMMNQIIGDTYTTFKISDRKFTHTDIAYYTFIKIMEAEKAGIELSKKGNYFYEIFENKVQYLLIDEFQDTSVIQWKILKPIIEGADKTICVGDEKQSIYSFRGGEKDLFGTLPEILNAEEKTLDTSYRSYENIIEFVNNFFFNLNNDWKYNKVNYLPDKTGGCVKCFLYDSKSESDCYENMKNLIIQNGDYEKSAVLARTNSVLEEIGEVLSESKVPALKESSLSILDYRSIKPFFYLLSFISKGDYFDLLLFLRSDLIFISEKTEQEMIEKKKSVMDYFATGNIGCLEWLNFDMQEIIIKIKRLKSESYENMTFLMFEIFNPFNKFRKISDSKNCSKLLTIMKNFTDVHSFVKFAEENRNSEQLKQEGASENNGITMMTIHKSKGLEFETVYFHIKAGKKQGSRNAFDNYIKYSNDFSKAEKLIFSNNLSDFAVEIFDNEIYNIKDKKEFDDWLNNLYVAFTRAKKNLYIFIEFGKSIEAIEKEVDSFNESKIYYTLKRGFENISGKSLSEVYSQGYSIGEFEPSLKSEDKSDEIENSEINPDLIYNLFQREYEYLEQNDEINLKYEMQYSQKIGVASHYYLSFLKNGSLEEKNRAFQMTMKKYGNMLGLKEVHKITEKLGKFADNSKEYFTDSQTVVNEFSIFDKSDNREYRIDKLIINETEKKCLIVDFKTGITKDISQLQKYKELVLNILPDYKIEAVFVNI